MPIRPECPEEFKPLVQDFKDRRGWIKNRRPTPFVLFGYHSNEKVGDKFNQPIPALFMLDCAGASGQASIIRYYVEKGYQIIDYAFPTLEEITKLDTVQKDQYGVGMIGRDSGVTVNPFTPLIAEIDMLLSGNRVAELEQQLHVMNQKVVEAEKRMKDQTDGKRGKATTADA